MQTVANANQNILVDPSELLTTGQAARLSNEYSRRGIQEAIKRGDLEAVQIGNRSYVTRQSLKNFLEMMREKGQSKFDPWASGKRTK